MKNKWQTIYQQNLKLDQIFEKKYFQDSEMYHKNCLELLTELGELANETKCFKYWSIKEPNKDKVLEEYADCITMVLYFFGYLELSLDDLPEPKTYDNILELFNFLFAESSRLYNHCDELIVKTIFQNLLQIKEFLNITETELQEACLSKQDIIFERLNSNY